MALAKVLPRGQITIPQEIREAVGLEPGATVQVHVSGPDTIQITVLPNRSIGEWIDRYRVETPTDYDAAVALGEEDAAAEAISRLNRETRGYAEGSP